jgi:uncharacterized protein (TIGR00288 family)
MSPWWLRPPADADGTEPADGRQAEAPAPPAGDDLLSSSDTSWSPPEPVAIEPTTSEEPRVSAPPFRVFDPESFEDDDDDSEVEGEDAADESFEGENGEVEHADGDQGAEAPETGETAEVAAAGRRRRRRRRRRGAGAGGAAAGTADEAVATPSSTPVATPAPVAAAPAPPSVTREAPAASHRSRGGRPARVERHEEEDEEDFEQPPVLSEPAYAAPSYSPDVYLPMRAAGSNEERKIALFCDFENIALGVRDSAIKQFDIHLVLERLLEKGKIIVKRAYADWERYSDHKRALHEAAIELIDIPQKSYSGKNSADIKMVVDAMDLCYAKEHLDTFVIMSGDSDFSPLVSKLKENNKSVIGVGVKNSSSALLIDNCDEFIFYEDVWRDRQGPTPQVAGLSKKQTEAFSLMVDAILALKRENKDVLWGSMIKQTMQRKKPSFNEGYFGYSTFSELLEDAQKNQVIKLKRDQRAGTYVVTGFARRK